MKYDVIIIGAGSGGYKSAEILADNGKHVLIIEKEPYAGGVCLSHGCIPTKSYVAVCESIEHIKQAKRMGIDINGEYSIDMKKILNRKDRIVKMLSSGLLKSLMDRGIDIITGDASIISNREVSVNNKHYTCEYIIIATGSLDKQLTSISGQYNNVLNSRQMLQTADIPKHLCVIGAGVIGLEMAMIFSQFGSEVHIVEYCPSILPGINNIFISDAAMKIIKNQNIQLILNDSVQSFDNNTLTLCSGKTLDADTILLAIGRYPVLPQCSFDIAVNDGFADVDSRNRTSVDNIYAIGDCINGPMLAHKAYYDAQIAAMDILGQGKDKDYTNIPYSIFLHPPLSHAGLSEEDCAAKGLNYTVTEYPYAGNGRAAAYGARNGIMRLIHDGDLLLGVSIWGKDSDIIIHELIPLLYHPFSLNYIKHTVHIHPTLSEIIIEGL